MKNMDEDFLKKLDCSIKTLLIAEKELKEKVFVIPDEISQLPNLKEFWKEIDTAVENLSFECTKLCISYSNEPYPTNEEVLAHLQSIELSVLYLFTVVYKFNICHGKTLQKKIVDSTVNSVESTRQLISLIKEGLGPDIPDRFRRATGIVWEGCKYLELCPKNNKIAAVGKLRDQEKMVIDAIGEITEALEGDGSVWQGFSSSSSSSEDEPEPKWTDEEKKKIIPSINVIKAAKITWKRLIHVIEKNGHADSVKQVTELDELVDVCTPINVILDDLVIELYPPLNFNTMEAETDALATYLFTVIKTAIQSHFVTENEQANIEFIKHAITHNVNKMKEILKES